MVLGRFKPPMRTAGTVTLQQHLSLTWEQIAVTAQPGCQSQPELAHSADSEKFAIPTADGTVLKLKSASSAAAGKRCLSYKAESSWKGSYRVSLLICQCKQKDSEISVFSLQGKIYKRSYIFGTNL